MPAESSDPRPDLPASNPEPANPPADADLPASDAAPADPPADADLPASDAAPADPPAEADLARLAEPATVRRAPKFGAFLTAGVLVGALVGFVLALVTGSALDEGGVGFISFLDGQGSARLLVAFAGAAVGALVAGLAAVVADRRSVRRR